MKFTRLKLNTAHLPANEEALVRCERGLELKDRGDYEAALEVMRPLWSDLGERPNIKGLYPAIAAEVLLSVGILTCWIGNRLQRSETQEVAKDLITESLTYFESTQDVQKAASARAELGYCYWWRGELNEARIMFVEALEKLTTRGTTRTRALLGLSIVEWSASKSSEALKILDDNAYLFQKINSHALRASYHNQRAVILRNLSAIGTGNKHIQQAIAAYKEADVHLKLAHNIDFRADLQNNLGVLLFGLCKFKEAHGHIEEARRLSAIVRDRRRTAQFDDTRAQVFIAERKFKQAEAVARGAVRVLERSGHQCLLADALVTQGIAVARLKRAERAQFIFQKAIEVASQVGALNKAGIAALTLIEEVAELSPDTLFAAYYQASDWLAKSQSQDLLSRLNAAARKVCAALYGATKGEGTSADEDAIEILLNKPCVLQTEVLKFEGRVIRQALSKANGSLTRAAAMLSMSYQALAYILESRHKELLKERSPIRRRSRKEATT